MSIVHFVPNPVDEVSVLWGADWLWGLPLIILTVVIHIVGMGFITRKAVQLSTAPIERSRHPMAIFVFVMSIITWLSISLHGLEAFIWAAAFRFLGALPNLRSAMLYSLGAVTSYGHAALSLQQRWQLMGAMEALNGWLLFGLTTAFMFGTIEKIWLRNSHTGHTERPKEDAMAASGGR